MTTLKDLLARCTPGPWSITPEVGGENFLHSIYGVDEGGDGGLLIARCDQNGEHSDDAELIAKSRTIAERMVELESLVGELCGIMENARIDLETSTKAQAGKTICRGISKARAAIMEGQSNE